MPNTDDLIDDIDSLIRRDPARRGLIASEAQFGPLCPGHLAQAARSLAATGRNVGIVTGFFVPAANPPAAETDGPPGAVFLAAVLEGIGVETMLVTDQNCASAVRAAVTAARLKSTKVYVVADVTTPGSEAFLTSGPGELLTHLIAIERVGPSHTVESISRQTRVGACPQSEFEREVPPECRGHCHNMRGEPIDDFAAPLYRLFEDSHKYRSDLCTIGIGDGANEIGMGGIPWAELRRRLEGPQAPLIPCRVETDWNIIAGTSNWGAYALAASVALLRGRLDVLVPLDREREKWLIEQLVANGPAVDGVTRQQEPTVDGLPFLTYIQPLEGIRRLLFQQPAEQANKETSI